MTPLTNFALRADPYRSARRTASWITTRGGVSPRLELRGGEAKHAALDHAEPLETPVGRDVGELGVEHASRGA